MTFDHRQPRFAQVHPETSGLTRRRCLGALALPMLAPGIARADSAPAAAADPWLDLFCGVDRPPVFWLTRADEFVVVDGASTAVKGRIGVLAAVARSRGDGTVRVSYLLLGCNVTPFGHAVVPALLNPVTGEPIPTAVGAPLKLGWTFAPGGVVTEDLLAANGTRAAYRGNTFASSGTGADRATTLRMNIELFRPTGAVESLTEISVLRPRGAADAGGRFTPALSETVTTREVLDKAGYPGTLVYSVSLSHGQSFRDVDELRRAMQPSETAALAAFFEQQARWARDV